MTKRGWGPAYRLSLTGDIEVWRAPTEDELWNLELELTQWRLAHPEAMPPELWEKLDQVIGWQTVHQYPWTREDIRRSRYVWVRRGIKRTGSLKRAWKYALDALRGSPARAGIEMIKRDYYQVKGSLTPRPRRRRAQRKK